MLCGVRKYAQPGHKTYLVHRFIYMCFNGVIAEGMEIDHINNNKEDNRLCNLQLLTPQENSKKAIKNIDYSFIKLNMFTIKNAIIKNNNVLGYQDSNP